MKFFRLGKLGTLALALVLAWGLSGVPAQADNLSPRDEAALFSLADLGPVDLSPKTVTVELGEGRQDRSRLKEPCGCDYSSCCACPG